MNKAEQRQKYHEWRKLEAPLCVRWMLYFAGENVVQLGTCLCKIRCSVAPSPNRPAYKVAPVRNDRFITVLYKERDVKSVSWDCSRCPKTQMRFTMDREDFLLMERIVEKLDK